MVMSLPLPRVEGRRTGNSPAAAPQSIASEKSTGSQRTRRAHVLFDMNVEERQADYDGHRRQEGCGMCGVVLKRAWTGDDRGRNADESAKSHGKNQRMCQAMRPAE